MAFVITVLLEQEDKQTTKDVKVGDKAVLLRDLQELLCTTFKYPFPKTMVSLRVDGTTYDDFQQPFAKGVPDEPCVVRFVETDNPYFYDWRDRRMAPAREALSPRALPVLPAFG